MNEERLRKALRTVPITGEEEASERALDLARAAFASSRPTVAPRRPGRRRTLQLAIALGLLVVAISPAGAAVRHLVGDAVDSDREPALPALTSLPAGGKLLVDSAQGPWIVRGDGSKRLLGSYRQAAWSPHGLYVVTASGHQIAAVDPAGTVRWTLSRPGTVRSPAWSADPYGERIAYLEGSDLRVVAGDGKGDRLLATGVSPIAPAWQPGPGHRLAFVEEGTIHLIDVDTGKLRWSVAAPPRLQALKWEPSGMRLLAVSPDGIDVRDGDGALLWRAVPPPNASFGSAAAGQAGEVAAVTVMGSGDRSALVLFDEEGSRERLIDSPGRLDEVVYSPGGRWLLVTWRSADQWLFLNPERPRHVVAIADIAAQFSPGATSPGSFPSIAGWCCAALPGE